MHARLGIRDLAAAARQIDGGIASADLAGRDRDHAGLRRDEGAARRRRPGDDHPDRRQCVDEAASTFPFRHLNEFTLSKDSLPEPVAVTVMEDNHLGRITPKAPVFLYHSVNDELIPFPSAQKLQSDWCASGATVTLYPDVLSEHSSLAVTGAPWQWASWLPASPASPPPTPAPDQPVGTRQSQ